MPDAPSSSPGPARPLKVAMILSDDREAHRRYEVPEPYFGPAPSALLDGLRQTPGVEVHVLSCVRRPVRDPGRLAENIFYHPLLIPEWGFLKSGYLPALRAIRRKLRELKADVAHGQGTERYYALAAVHSGLPNLITIHGNMRRLAELAGARPFSFAWTTARLEAWALRRTGGVICLSRHTERLVAPLTARTWLLPNAVDAGYFSVVRPAQPPPVILCVANILPYKGQIELIRALEPVAAERQFTLVFLGRTEPAEPYSAEFLRLVGERPWCAHKGYLSGAELKAQFGQARLLALPTFEDNCPMVVLEAMAAGLPVAASRVGGIPDLIQDGVTGLLFDPEDAGAMRAAVVRLLTDADAAAALATAARRQAQAAYHPTVVAREHLRIYTEVLSSPRGR